QVRVDNTAGRRLFVTITARGVPASGHDTADASGLTLEVDYRDEEGAVLDVSRLPQGSDLIARIGVTNTTPHRIDNLALAQRVPAGWAVRHERMERLAATGERDAREVPRRAWWLETAASNVEHVAIRAARIYRFFSLKPKARLIVTTRLNAAYRGRFYLPS